MTFPINSPERMSLVPVIATLLQFNPKEIVEVDKSSKDPNWSKRPVKEIRRSLHKASTYSMPSQHGGHIISDVAISSRSSELIAAASNN